MRMFSEGEILHVFRTVIESIKTQVHGESEDYILNVNQTQYCTHLTTKYKIDFPELHFDKVSADSYEKDIPADQFPHGIRPYIGKTHKRDIIRFYVPFTGDIHLLEYRPASRYTLSGGMEIKTLDGALIFEYVNIFGLPDAIKADYDRDVKQMMSNYNYLKADCEKFNDSLLDHTNKVFEQRKQQFLSKKNLLSSLGVPVRQSKDVPGTFSVRSPQIRERLSIKPVVHEKGYSPEPTLNQELYNRILRIIRDAGQVFEKYPSTYRDKKEEDLRDHILLLLQPNFENATATGETFNKRGKTDILLKYQSANVFIAECKFWKGIKQLHATIDQLLSYSTWRDTKSAVVFFVQNQSISNVLDTVDNHTCEHSNFLGFVNKIDESWFNYRFHLNGDKNREIHVAIMLFHIPA